MHNLPQAAWCSHQARHESESWLRTNCETSGVFRQDRDLMTDGRRSEWCDLLDRAWNMCHDHDLSMRRDYPVMQMQAPCAGSVTLFYGLPT